MSLINKMLKDLEGQDDVKEGDSNRKDLLEDLHVPVFPEKKRKPKIALIFVLILLALGLLVFIIYRRNNYSPLPFHNLNKKPKISQVKKILSTKEKQQKPSTTIISPKKEPVSFLMKKETEVKLTGYTVNAQQNLFKMTFFLTAPAHYLVKHSNDHRRIVITLTKTIAVDKLPIFSPNDWIKSLIVRQIQDGTEIIMLLQPKTTLRRLKLTTKPIAQLSIHFSRPVSKGIMQKALLAPTSMQKAEMHYQKALRLLQKEQQMAAQAELGVAIQVAPDYLPARKVLAMLLFNMGRIRAANHLAIEGLRQASEDIFLVKIRAYCLAKSGAPSRALALLQQHAPLLQNNLDYYAFMASLYQRLGKYSLAVDMYDKLTKARPDNGLWWLGLGVALESLGNNNAAIQAYSNALRNNATLTPGAQAYLESKIGNIRGG